MLDERSEADEVVRWLSFMLIATGHSEGCVVTMIPRNTVQRMDDSARTGPRDRL